MQTATRATLFLLLAVLSHCVLPETLRADLFVSSPGGAHPYAGYRYDNQGTFLGPFGDVSDELVEEFLGITVGPDGDLYANNNSIGTGSVLRFSGKTGDFMEEFIPLANDGFNRPAGLAFGPDQNLYVTSNKFHTNGTTGVLRYNGQTGAFMNVFVPEDSGGLADPYSLAFMGDGSLLVSANGFNGSSGPYGVFHYDASGNFIDLFVPNGVDGLSNPQGITIGPDSNLYVASFGSDNVLRYNGQTGEFIDIFASGGGLDAPRNLSFGPDGNLYVSEQNRILRYNGQTGAFLNGFVSESGDIDLGPFFTFTPVPEPSSLVLAAIGLVGLGLAARRKR